MWVCPFVLFLKLFFWSTTLLHRGVFVWLNLDKAGAPFGLKPLNSKSMKQNSDWKVSVSVKEIAMELYTDNHDLHWMYHPYFYDPSTFTLVQPAGSLFYILVKYLNNFGQITFGVHASKRMKSNAFVDPHFISCAPTSCDLTWRCWKCFWVIIRTWMQKPFDYMHHIAVNAHSSKMSNYTSTTLLYDFHNW